MLGVDQLPHPLLLELFVPLPDGCEGGVKAFAVLRHVVAAPQSVERLVCCVAQEAVGDIVVGEFSDGLVADVDESGRDVAVGLDGHHVVLGDHVLDDVGRLLSLHQLTCEETSLLDGVVEVGDEVLALGCLAFGVVARVEAQQRALGRVVVRTNGLGLLIVLACHGSSPNCRWYESGLGQDL